MRVRFTSVAKPSSRAKPDDFTLDDIIQVTILQQQMSINNERLLAENTTLK